MPEPSATEWAYAAGFVDGEGCIAIAREFSRRAGRHYYGVQVVVANTDRGALESLRAVWGGYVVPASKGDERSRESWAWRLSSGQARPFLVGIQPYLRIKGAQCQNAIQMSLLLSRSRRTLGPNLIPADWLVEQEQLYWRQRELNHRGTAAFERKAMHSPRRIHRERTLGPRPAELKLTQTVLINIIRCG